MISKMFDFDELRLNTGIIKDPVLIESALILFLHANQMGLNGIKLSDISFNDAECKFTWRTDETGI